MDQVETTTQFEQACCYKNALSIYSQLVTCHKMLKTYCIFFYLKIHIKTHIFAQLGTIIFRNLIPRIDTQLK